MLVPAAAIYRLQAPIEPARASGLQDTSKLELSITLAAMLRQGGNLESLGEDRLLRNNVVGPVAERAPADVDAVRLQRREQRIGPHAALARRLRLYGAPRFLDGVDEVLQSFASSQRPDRTLRAIVIRRQPLRQSTS